MMFRNLYQLQNIYARPGKADQVIQSRAKIFESVKMDSGDVWAKWLKTRYALGEHDST